MSYTITISLTALCAVCAVSAHPDEILTTPAAGKQPHILMVLFDDYGWADAGWHRNYTAPGGAKVPYTEEVQTPTLNGLVQSGIELNRNYIYKYCSPTRSALQSGRNPYHVNPINAAPTLHNPADPVSGFAAIPRNMTGIATKLAAAGYKTAAFGKWDAGMATPDHTPHGRGYDIALNYFHHCNDYWSMAAGSCNRAPPAPPAPPAPTKCSASLGGNYCLESSPEAAPPTPTKDSAACCALCSANDKCNGWAWGKSFNAGRGMHSCHLKAQVLGKVKGNCTSACRTHAPHDPNSCAGGGKKDMVPVVDLWQKVEQGTEGPAHGLNSTCQGQQGNGAHPAACVPGPNDDHWYSGYEDSLFEQHLLSTIETHDPAQPLFVFWAPHIVHAPLQVPQSFLDKFAFIEKTDKAGHQRQLYHAMVNFADEALANITAAYKRKGMYDDLLIVFSTDNGGPVYASGSAGANNYPLKGGKMNNWEGGIRGNGFISGGFVPEARRGTRYEGMTTAWDWYATFSALAGVDPTDHRAALANLPPIDSKDHSAMILGTNLSDARLELPIGTEPRPSELPNAPLCSSYNPRTTYYEDPKVPGDEITSVAQHLLDAGENADTQRCTTVSGLTLDERGQPGGTLWKLLTGDVQQDFYQGPHYPNTTTTSITPSVAHCGNGCLYDLIKDPLESTDLAGKMPAKVAAMRTRLIAYEGTAFNPDRGTDDGAACSKAFDVYGGFWGPFLP